MAHTFRFECWGRTMLRPLSISHYLNVMQTLGYGRDDLIAGTAIDPHALLDPDYLVSNADHQRFLRNMIALHGDNGLGLDLGLTNEAPHFGILAYAGLSCRTIRHGLQDVWSRYGGAFGVATRLSIIFEDDETAIVEISAPHLDEAIYRFSIEEALCVLCKIGGAVAGEQPPFGSLMLSYPRPAYGVRYRNIFSCPVEFEGHITCVAIRRAWLDSPLKTSDSELNRACLEHLDRVLRQTEAASPITLRLRHLLLSRVGSMPTSAEAAKTFGLSSRTLSRHLQQDGYTYRQLTEEIRMELAKRWLAAGSVTTKEISYRLGFGDVASFRRAFKTWTGRTVGEFLTAPARDGPNGP